MNDFILYIKDNYEGILLATWQHFALCLISLLIGSLIALGIASFTVINGKNIDQLITVLSFIRLIPGIAILMLGMPVFGVGVPPAIFTMVILCVPTILINLYTGIKSISPDLIEIGNSMGLSRTELYRKVQFPLAKPFLILGLRTASIDVITVATVASLMGAGGLGRYVMTGLLINNLNLTLVGSLIIAVMAILSEVSLGYYQKKLLKQRRT